MNINPAALFRLILGLTFVSLTFQVHANPDDPITTTAHGVVKVLNLSFPTPVVQVRKENGEYGPLIFFDKNVIFISPSGNGMIAAKIEPNGEWWMGILDQNFAWNRQQKMNTEEILGCLGGGTGSGFAVGDGYLVTNHHVIKARFDETSDFAKMLRQATDGGPVRFRAFYRRGFFEETYDKDLAQDKVLIAYLDQANPLLHIRVATILGSDDRKDLALLQVRGLDLPPLRFSTRELNRLDKVIAIGYPGVGRDIGHSSFSTVAYEYIRRALAEKVRSGSIDWLDHVEMNSAVGSLQTDFTPNIQTGWVGKIATWTPLGEPLKTIFHDAPIAGGNSGGPLVDETGQVVGINTWGTPEDANAQFSQHRDVITEFLARRNVTPLLHKDETKEPVTPPSPVDKVEEPAKAPVEKDEVKDKGITGFFRRHHLIVILGGTTIIGLTVILVVARKKKVQPRGSVIPVPGPGPAPATIKRKDAGRSLLSRRTGWARVVTLSLQNKSGQAFTFQLDEKQFSRNRGYLVVGRDNQFSDIAIPDGSVSAQHFGLLWGDNGAVSIEDRNSTNGTQLAGRRIAPFKAAPLTGASPLTIGDLAGTISVG